MGIRKFTNDEVKILITYIDFFYEKCLEENVKSFKGQTKYEIVKEILKTIEANEKRKPTLTIVKS